MGKLITAKIDVTKINKDLLFKGTKGIYLDLTIWINDKPDQYGNDISIEQRVKPGENKIYLGNGKFFVKKEETGSAMKEAIVNKSKEQADDMSDLPF